MRACVGDMVEIREGNGNKKIINKKTVNRDNDFHAL